MNRSSPALLLTFLAAVLAVGASAQLVAPNLRTVTMRDGLSSDHVQSMAVDGRGYLWIGTSDGLNRFDGRRVKVYRYEGRPDALPGDKITALAWDGARYLLIGTNAPYLTLLDPLADTLHRVPLPIPAFSAHGEQRVTDLLVDGLGRIWVAHGARCLSLFDVRTRSFTTVEIPPPAPTARSREVISGMLEDAQGILWLATFRGLVRFDPATRTARSFPLNPVDGHPGHAYTFQVRGMVDEDSTLLVGTWSEGIFRVRKRDGETRLLWPSAVHAPTFVDHMVQDMDRVGEHVLIATIDQGVLRLDPRTGRVDHFDRSLDEADCRKREDLFVGASRLLVMDVVVCIGSYTQGVALLSARNNIAQGFHLPDEPAADLIDEVLAVHRDAGTGKVLALSHRRGLFVHDAPGRRTDLIALPHAPDRRYLDLLELSTGRYLLSSMDGPLLADLRTGVLEPPAFIAPRSVCAGAVWWARGDGAHGLWCMTGANGLHHLDTLTRECRPIADVFPAVAALLGNWPLDVFTDRSGRAWFLSATQAPVVCYPDGRVERLASPPGLEPFEVSDIAETPDGRVWLVVKHTGLVRIDPDGSANGPLVLHDASSDLPTRNLLEVVAMADGTLWFTRPSGLLHWDPATGHARMVSRADGLPVSPLNLDESEVPVRGPLLAGAWEGFLELRGDAVLPTAPPRIQVPAVWALDRLLSPHVDMMADQVHAVPYDHARITLQLRSTNLVDPQRDEYAYRLVGVDSAWVLLPPEDRLTFNSLAPGTYRLELKARTNRGPWGEVTAVRLRVLPPFWATWWFRLLMVVVAAALIWIAFRIVLRIRLARQRAVLERERAVLEERIRIAQDLHDDLGSGLASIGMESDLAQLELEDARARALLEKVGDGARQVSDNMRRIVWALGSGQETLGDLVAYVRGFAAELLDQRGIDLRMTAELTDPRHKLTVDERRHLLLFTKEALNNVIRHADARNVTIDIRQREDGLSWVIADDGRGFDPAVHTGMGTGSASMQARARALGAELVIHAAPGRGCRLTMRVPFMVSGVLEHGRPAHRPA